MNTMKNIIILNSIAQYLMHMKEREREKIELNLKVQKTVQEHDYLNIIHTDILSNTDASMAKKIIHLCININ